MRKTRGKKDAGASKRTLAGQWPGVVALLVGLACVLYLEYLPSNYHPRDFRPHYIGIAVVTILTTVLATVFIVVGQRRRGQSTWHGLDIVALLLCGVIAACTGYAAIANPYYRHAQQACLDNQRHIIMLIEQYAQDHQDHLPDGKTIWTDLNMDKGYTICPLTTFIENCYGYNPRLSRLPLHGVRDPARLVVTADSDSRDNLLHTWTDVTPRHEGHAIVSCLDGHAEVATMPDLRLEVGR